MAVTETSNEADQTDEAPVDNPVHNSLAEALAAFHLERPNVMKDSENTHYQNKYASLNAFEAKVLPLLAKHGLTWTCLPSISPESEGLVLQWQLIHGASGDTWKGYWPLVQGTPQQIGSSLTYAKRYLLSAVTGVSAEDDDNGEAASKAQRPDPAATDWDAVLTTARAAADLPALRKLYVTARVGSAPQDVRDAFTGIVDDFSKPTPEDDHA